MSRAGIYYWKCDRPAAFHGTLSARDPSVTQGAFEAHLRSLHPGSQIQVRQAGSPGNHVTCVVSLDGEESFARIEDGPEGDGHMVVEAAVLARVGAAGVPVPRVLAMDASRSRVPFAWQRLELIAAPDLNHGYKQGRLDLPALSRQIGEAVARWQGVEVAGFGPFDPEKLRQTNSLVGYHDRYADYFHLNLERHLSFLVERSFMTPALRAEITTAVSTHASLLDLPQGCLVHKDLALWNILGTPGRIESFIDWDDAISGDPMDDLSLLGCFYDGRVLGGALEGYQTVRLLPVEHRRRFWIHLLRNMIVKAVIRVGAGYFDRSDQFFLINSGADGANLKAFTHERLRLALQGLLGDDEITSLGLSHA